MLTYNFSNSVERQKKLKWHQAFRFEPQSQERWIRRVAEWNPSLLISTRIKRKARRPAKRWEDDLNEFVKDEDTEGTQSNDLKNNDTWLAAATNVYDLEIKKNDNTLNILSMTEEANITQIHDDKILTHSSTDDDTQQQHHQRRRVFELQYYVRAD